MARLADGDREAFDPLYETLWPVVHRFAERALAGAPAAEDAAQTALLNVFSRASEFDAERDALSWVLEIVAYECRTIRQRARRRREEPASAAGLEAIRDGGQSPEEIASLRELSAATAAAIGTLR